MTTISATWMWEEVSAETFWLKLMATLKDASGLPLEGKTVNLTVGGSWIGTKTTGSDGEINHYYVPFQYEGIKSFGFLFDGDGIYEGTGTSLDVEYMVNPPISPPVGNGLPIIPILIGAGILAYFMFRG